MQILVIGSGGREHALVWKLVQSRNITQIWCAPGNAGVAAEPLASGGLAQCVGIPADDIHGLLDFARKQCPDLTVVGPDNPLALGIVDLFAAHGLPIWGPNRQATQFEASKAFAQQFMQRHGIPTARSGVFDQLDRALNFVSDLGGACAVKADGLALGKGVLICHDLPAARAAIKDILLNNAFGPAGKRIVIQEYLEGTEISLHALCDGRSAVLFPTSQDHKRALDDDFGLNTGGMGAYSPTPFLSDAALQATRAAIIDPWLRGCEAEGIDYRGILYPGIMLTANGPKVLEFNARFGDPETQVYMVRLRTDLLDLFRASLAGTLHEGSIEWTPTAAVCVVLASAGYPGAYKKGKRIDGLEAVARLANVKVFHAGTALRDGACVSNGGRVLGVTAWGPDLASARATAYDAASRIHFDGLHFRRDIGAKGLGYRA